MIRTLVNGIRNLRGIFPLPSKDRCLPSVDLSATIPMENIEVFPPISLTKPHRYGNSSRMDRDALTLLGKIQAGNCDDYHLRQYFSRNARDCLQPIGDDFPFGNDPDKVCLARLFEQTPTSKSPEQREGSGLMVAYFIIARRRVLRRSDATIEGEAGNVFLRDSSRIRIEYAPEIWPVVSTDCKHSSPVLICITRDDKVEAFLAVPPNGHPARAVDYCPHSKADRALMSPIYHGILPIRGTVLEEEGTTVIKNKYNQDGTMTPVATRPHLDELIRRLDHGQPRYN